MGGYVKFKFITAKAQRRKENAKKIKSFLHVLRVFFAPPRLALYFMNVLIHCLYSLLRVILSISSFDAIFDLRSAAAPPL